ncbi:MAG: 50S ribosomal protein L6 [Saccharofermentans sp.]|jgi:large subunit ribosomal protein L6|nr:50S ribosomal protein L6 [Mageeibacillus sp.]MCI1264469.1 50S ribosomal protein L6 [Saccharofermentans sp.]MCI1275126.1 50S ribosomal protein L6 [Saccharofermentans sp.]MCI1768832.1 50S ribosomal protein L6 [Mageeibacillus sp.]
MSRIGRKPIAVPAGVEVKIDGQHVTVKGGKSVLEMNVHPDISVKQEGSEIIVERSSDDKNHRALHGLTRALINNMVVGVSDGFSKNLEINGVGYKAVKQGNKVVFSLGYSHTIEMVEPEGISIDVKDNIITVKGADKQLVGETSAKIRSLRVPDVYKGKGIKYADEHLIIKEGKTGAKK